MPNLLNRTNRIKPNRTELYRIVPILCVSQVLRWLLEYGSHCGDHQRPRGAPRGARERVLFTKTRTRAAHGYGCRRSADPKHRRGALVPPAAAAASARVSHHSAHASRCSTAGDSNKGGNAREARSHGDTTRALTTISGDPSCIGVGVGGGGGGGGSDAQASLAQGANPVATNASVRAGNPSAKTANIGAKFGCWRRRAGGVLDKTASGANPPPPPAAVALNITMDAGHDDRGSLLVADRLRSADGENEGGPKRESNDVVTQRHDAAASEEERAAAAAADEASPWEGRRRRWLKVTSAVEDAAAAAGHIQVKNRGGT